MRKNQRFSPTQQVDQQTEQAHARRMPSGVSNATGQQEMGTEGRGASEAEMSLSGSFADFILDCMPFADALCAAIDFASNPTVLEWASQYTVADVVSVLQQPSDALLNRIWPVGIGFDAEAQVGGRLAGGVDVWARTSAMRTDVDQMNLLAQYRGSVGLDGMGVGVQLTDAFGETTVAAMTKAGIHLEAEVCAHQQTSFDLFAVLRASKNLTEQSVTDLLVHPLAPAQFLIPEEWVKRLDYLCMEDWEVDRTLHWKQGITSSMGHMDPDRHASLGDMAVSQPFSTLVGSVVPMMQSGVFSRCSVRFEGLTAMILEASISAQASIQGLLQLASVNIATDEPLAASLSGEMGLGSERTFLWVVDLNGRGLESAVDRDRSGFSVQSSTRIAGGVVSDEQFVSLAALDAVAGMAESGNPLAGRVDWSRMVEIDLTDDLLAEQCPPIMHAVLASEGLLRSAEVDLRLVGKVDLKAEASFDVWNDMFSGSSTIADVGLHEVFGLVVDLAFDSDVSLPEWARVWRAQLIRLSTLLEFSDARLVGHVHQGIGGGAEISMGAGAEILGRAEGGAMIDVPINAAGLNPIQMGNSSSASPA